MQLIAHPWRGNQEFRDTPAPRRYCGPVSRARPGNVLCRRAAPATMPRPTRAAGALRGGAAASPLCGNHIRYCITEGGALGSASASTTSSGDPMSACDARQTGRRGAAIGLPFEDERVRLMTATSGEPKGISWLPIALEQHLAELRRGLPLERRINPQARTDWAPLQRALAPAARGKRNSAWAME
jgi:hypothetical protein